MLFLAEDLFYPGAIVVLEVDDWLEDVRLAVVVGRVVAAVVADQVLFSLVLAACADGVTVFQPGVAVHADFII